MASQQDRGLNIFHHNKKEGEPQLDDTLQTEDGVTQASQDAKDHKRHEHLGEAAGLATGGYGLYEGHEAKKDPEHARRHKLEEEIAGVGAVGAGGYALHEHHEKKGDEKEAGGF
eukprot:Unigene237_Nuclearia_a/m.856 Unigene237_Nuclearia_a/g.856  ORF Unigene237_Nuclearia_a/g.856 Unigene237_Nuclearia_a/m.856 type:complete len:114 (+) Unigene237_Nuclearia_a:102-443(+)